MARERSRTTRTVLNGWQVYVIEDPALGRTMVLVRAEKWRRGADNSPAFKVSNPVGSVALMEAQRWCETHPHPSAADAAEPAWGPAENNWGSWQPEQPSRPSEEAMKPFHVLAAKKFLGAEDCRNRSELKQRLVGISQTEHPDRGGNPARWRMLIHAYNFLNAELKDELPMSYDS